MLYPVMLSVFWAAVAGVIVWLVFKYTRHYSSAAGNDSQLRDAGQERPSGRKGVRERPKQLD